VESARPQSTARRPDPARASVEQHRVNAVTTVPGRLVPAGRLGSRMCRGAAGRLRSVRAKRCPVVAQTGVAQRGYRSAGEITVPGIRRAEQRSGRPRTVPRLSPLGLLAHGVAADQGTGGRARRISHNGNSSPVIRPGCLSGVVMLGRFSPPARQRILSDTQDGPTVTDCGRQARACGGREGAISPKPGRA